MKYIYILLVASLLQACSQNTYIVEIKYQDGKQETIRVKSVNYPNLDDGCIYFSTQQAVRCGVKSFTYHTEELKTE